jgi:hypothetical protein
VYVAALIHSLLFVARPRRRGESATMVGMEEDMPKDWDPLGIALVIVDAVSVLLFV